MHRHKSVINARPRHASPQCLRLAAGLGLLSLSALLPASAQTTSTTADAKGTEPIVTLEKFVIVDYSKTASGMGESETRATVSVPKVDIAVMPAGQNPIILLAKTPGINVQSSDNIGLYEHANRVQVRSFNINQIAVTLDDVPMGQQNFYGGTPVDRLVDSESIERVDVSTGIGAVWMPATASLGGAMRYYTMGPKEETGVMLSQSIGDNGFNRSFARYDTGTILPGLSAFGSYSVLKADKWRGKGIIHRTHGAAQIQFKTGEQVFRLKFDLNDRADNDYRSMSLAIYRQFGRFYEYQETVTGNKTLDGVYWDNQFNFRRDLVVSLEAKLKLSDSMRLSVVPYYDDKFLHGGGNQDGTTGTPLASYQLSLTSTPTNLSRMVSGKLYPITAPRGILFSQRKGVQLRRGLPLKFEADVGPQTFTIGAWYQNDYYTRADVRWNREGGVAGGRNLDYQEFVYGNHDVYHRFYTTQLSIEDRITLLDKKLVVTAGAKSLKVQDDFEGIKNATDYSLNNTSKFGAVYKDNFIPSVGAVFDLTRNDQLFTSYAENMGQPVKEVYYSENYPAKSVRAETSQIYELGWRANRGKYNFTVGSYLVKYGHRLFAFNDFDPTFNRTVSSYNDVGGITSKGLEVAAAIYPLSGLRFSTSLTYNKTTFDSDYVKYTSATAFSSVPTSGKFVPDFPEYMVNAELNYKWHGFYAGMDARYLARRYSNPINTEWLGGYTTYGALLGYQAPGNGKLGRLRLQFNVSNLFDKDYLGTISPGETTGSFQPGAPRTMYMAVSTEF
jgi:iron complex outermembrane recepter protein